MQICFQCKSEDPVHIPKRQAQQNTLAALVPEAGGEELTDPWSLLFNPFSQEVGSSFSERMEGN